MSDIKISVLTSLYKHEEVYVRQCLDSLCTQTLQDCEFILIDNGADENNKKLIKEYLRKDLRFRSIHLEKNIGMGAALNCGLASARGEYIGFLESDDFATEDMFFDLYSKSLNGKVDIVKSFFQVLDKKGNTKLEKNFPNNQCEKILKHGECSGLIQGHVSHWSGIYRRQFLIDNKINFNETPGGHSQDFGFILMCYAYANSVFITPKVYVSYRIYTGQHDWTFLNNNMIDELELTCKKLRGNLSDEVKEVIFKRVALRLLQIKKTSFIQKLRIRKILKFFHKVNFRYFSEEEKFKTMLVLRHPILKFLYCVNKSLNVTKIRIIRVPVLKIKHKKNIKRVYLLGLLVFKKKFNAFDLLPKKFREKVLLCHQKFLPLYKNIHEDKGVVICGSGPSINYYQQLEEAIHIGLNRIYEKQDIYFDYIFCWDLPNLIKNDPLYFDKIKSYPAQKIVGQFMSDTVLQASKEQLNRLKALPVYSSARHCIYPDWMDSEIYYNIEKYPLMDFGSVAFGAFHFALYTGCKKIYLVGLDNQLNGYFKKEHEQQFLMTERIFSGWLQVKKFIEKFYPNVEVFSVNPVGLKGIFHDVYTKSYLESHPEDKNDSVEILE